MEMDWHEAPARSRGWLRWLWVPLALAGGVAVLVFSMISRQQGMQARIWPIVRQTAGRLQTDDGALDLYRKNPDLRRAYANEAAFLDKVRANRAAFAALPEAEPADHMETYRPSPNPAGFRVLLKGQGEAWMELEVQASPPFGMGPEPQGEGIEQLAFGDSKEAARHEARVASSRRHQPEWDAYRSVLASLATDAGAASLYRANPGLAKVYPTEAAFLDAARGWRPKLGPVPEDILEAKERLTSMRIHSGPFLRQVSMVYVFPDLKLRAAWEEDHLVALGPAKPGEEAPIPPAPPAPPEPSPSGAPGAPAPRD